MSYTVEETAHGVMILGPIGIDDLTALSEAWKKRGLTQMVTGIPGATWAVSRPGSVDAWKAEIDARAVREASGDRELAWLRGSDTGISSRTIFSVLSGKHGAYALTDHWGPGTPSDPDDFGRCHRLLKAIPEWRPLLREVTVEHPEWAPLVREWDACEALYLEEEPTGSAPKLYRLMKRLLKEGGAR